jgi:threonine dehydratase
VTLDRNTIAKTYALIRAHIRRTPILDWAADGFSPGTVTLKLELHQHAGSFKARGAFAHLLTRAIPEAGLVAASGGNHGAAVAYAAQQKGVKATIFVPAISSPAKIARIRDFGAQLVIEGDSYADAYEKSLDWQKQSGALMIHAFDQQQTLLGQGTLGLELEEQAPDLDTLLVAVGGGGLIGGIAAWYGGRIQVIGVEPEASPTLACALKAGRPVEAPVGGLAADSLAPRQIGRLAFAIARQFVAQVVLVADQEIRIAQNALWQEARIVAEPGGAAAFAALCAGRYVPRKGERVGVVISGGNSHAVNFG